MKVNIFLFLLLSLSRQLHYNNEEFGGLVLKLYNFNYLHSKDFFKPKRIKYKEEISYKVLKLVPVLEQVLIVQAPWKLILPAPKGPVFFFLNPARTKNTQDWDTQVEIHASRWKHWYFDVCLFTGFIHVHHGQRRVNQWSSRCEKEAIQKAKCRYLA